MDIIIQGGKILHMDPDVQELAIGQLQRPTSQSTQRTSSE
jgi:hypothetical protein